MTPAEHKLVLTMSQQQQATITALIEILEDRKVIQDGDLLARKFTLHDSGKVRIIQNDMAEVYRGNAANLGVLASDLPDGTY